MSEEKVIEVRFLKDYILKLEDQKHEIHEIPVKAGIETFLYETTVLELVKQEIVEIIGKWEVEERKTIDDYENIETIMKKERKPISWLVGGWIPNHSQTLLAGKPGSCKSFLTEHLAFCLVTGESFLGLEVKKLKRVLILDMENDEDVWNERFTFMKNEYKFKGELPIDVWHPETIDLFQPEDYEKLKDKIEKNEIDLLIIDTTSRVLGLIENNDNDIINQLYMTRLKPLYNEFPKLSLIMISHMRKGTGEEEELIDMVRGAGDWVAIPQVVMSLRPHKRVENRFILKHLKIRRSKKQKELVFEIQADDKPQTFVNFKVVNEEEEKKLLVDECYNKILQYLTENKLIEFETGKKLPLYVEIHKDFSESTIEETIRRLRIDGRIERQGKGKYIFTPEGIPQDKQLKLTSKKELS